MMSDKRSVSTVIKETWQDHGRKGAGTMRRSLYILTSLHLYIFLALLLASCSSDYRSALPSGSTAIVAVDAADESLSALTAGLRGLLGIDDISQCGIDLAEPLYLFTTSDGTLGLCAKTGNASDLAALMERNATRGMARQIAERQGCQYYNVKGVCVAGWNGTALVALGPVVASAEGAAVSQIATLLKQDEDASAAAGPLMTRLDSLDGPMRLVARATALPEKLRPMLTLGLPREADAEQCLIAASVAIDHGTLTVDATPTSLKTKDDKALRDAYSKLRPIRGRYLAALDSTAEAAVLLNTEGRDLVPLLNAQPAVAAMLAGINQAIDLTAILRGVSGDLLLAARDVRRDLPTLSLAAELGDTSFLKDVGYWKQSLPKGFTLTDWRPQAYRLRSKDTDLWLGVAAGTRPEFYSGSTPAAALGQLAKAGTAAAEPWQRGVTGHRLAVVVSLAALFPESAAQRATGVERVLYRVK